MALVMVMVMVMATVTGMVTATGMVTVTVMGTLQSQTNDQLFFNDSLESFQIKPKKGYTKINVMVFPLHFTGFCSIESCF